MSRRFVIQNKHARYLRRAERDDRLTPTQGERGGFGGEESPRILTVAKADQDGIAAATVSGTLRTAGVGLADLYRLTAVGGVDYEKTPDQYGGKITVYNWFSSPIAGNAWILLEQDQTFRYWVTAEDCPQTIGGNEKCPAWPSQEDWDSERPATIYGSFSGQPTCCVDVVPASNIAMDSTTDCGDDCVYCADLNTVAGDEVKLYVSFSNSAGITAWIDGTTGQNCDGFVQYGAAPITDPDSFDVTLAFASGSGALATCYAGLTLRITSAPV